MGKKWGKFPYETHVRLTQEAEQALSELAALEGRPVAAIIREVLDRHLETALPAARHAHQFYRECYCVGCKGADPVKRGKHFGCRCYLNRQMQREVAHG